MRAFYNHTNYREVHPELPSDILNLIASYRGIDDMLYQFFLLPLEADLVYVEFSACYSDMGVTSTYKYLLRASSNEILSYDDEVVHITFDSFIDE